MPLPFSFQDLIDRRRAAEEAKYPSLAGLPASVMGLAGAPMGTAPSIPTPPSMRFIPKESIVPKEPDTTWGDVGTGFARGFGRVPFEAAGMISNLAGLVTQSPDFMWLGKELQDESRRQFPPTTKPSTEDKGILDILQNDPVEFANYVSNNGPQVAASTLLTMVPGMAAGRAAGFVSAFGKVNPKLLGVIRSSGVWKEIGGLKGLAEVVGAGTGGVALEAQDIGSTAYQDTGKFPDRAKLLATSLLPGIMEAGTPIAMLRGGGPSIIKNTLAGIAREGTTEAIQTPLEETGVKALKGTPYAQAAVEVASDPAARERALRAGIVGSFAGGGMSMFEGEGGGHPATTQQALAVPPGATIPAGLSAPLSKLPAFPQVGQAPGLTAAPLPAFPPVGQAPSLDMRSATRPPNVAPLPAPTPTNPIQFQPPAFPPIAPTIPPAGIPPQTPGPLMATPPGKQTFAQRAAAVAKMIAAAKAVKGRRGAMVPVSEAIRIQLEANHPSAYKPGNVAPAGSVPVVPPTRLQQVLQSLRKGTKQPAVIEGQLAPKRIEAPARIKAGAVATPPPAPVRERLFSDADYSRLHSNLVSNITNANTASVAVRWVSQILGDSPVEKGKTIDQIVSAVADTNNKATRKAFEVLTGIKLPPNRRDSLPILKNARSIINDRKAQGRIPRPVGTGQEPGGTVQGQGPGGETTQAGGNVQTDQKGVGQGVQPDGQGQNANGHVTVPAVRYGVVQSKTKIGTFEVWDSQKKEVHSTGFVSHADAQKKATGLETNRKFVESGTKQETIPETKTTIPETKPSPGETIKPKEPWQMTHAEYLQGKSGPDEIAISNVAHAQHVKRAVEEGKPVPPEVLNYYRNNGWAKKALEYSPNPVKSGYGESNTLVSSTRAEEIRKKIRAKLQQITAGVDPELMALGAELAVYHIEAGARSFADYTKAMVTDLGEKIKPFLRSFYESARHWPGLENKGMSSTVEIESEVKNAQHPTNTKDTGKAPEQPVKGQGVKAGERGGPVAQPPVAVAGTVAPGESSGVRAPTAGQQPAGERTGPGDKGGGIGPATAQKAGNVGAGSQGNGTPGSGSTIRGTKENASTTKGPPPVHGVVGQSQLTAADKNHVIEGEGPQYGGAKTARALANIEAMRLLETLDKEKQNATPEEKKILENFTGWGALSEEVFNTDYDNAARGKIPYWWDDAQKKEFDKWKRKYGSQLHPALGGMMSEAEWTKAAASTLNAHYTSIPIVKAMWGIAQRLGFKGGAVLEPSAGSGNFFGAMPGNISEKSDLTGVELDSVTGRILKALYPQAEIHVKGFEETKLENNSQDLIISNVPFGNFKVHDTSKKPYSDWSIHNYFFGKSLDLLRPGGTMIFITSAWTMNSMKNRQVREYLSDKADFLGAIRLPGTAFAKAADTKVVTDIIVLRKKDGTNTGQITQPWGEVATLDLMDKNGKVVPSLVNSYFVSNPGMIVGQQSIGRGLRSDSDYIVEFDGDVGAAVTDRIKNFPEGIMSGKKTKKAERVTAAAATSKDGTYQLDASGNAVYVSGGRNTPIDFSEFKDRGGKLQVGRGRLSKDEILKHIAGYVTVREAATGLFKAQRDSNISEADLAIARQKLNTEYDRFNKQFGAFNEFSHAHPIWDDIEFPAALALERDVQVETPTGSKTVWKKEAVFTERTEYPHTRPTTATSVQDAVDISMTIEGGINTEYIAEMLGMTEAEARKKVLSTGFAFENPATGLLEHESDYLSGMVQKKLGEAQSGGAKYEDNVKALEKIVLPEVKQDRVDLVPGSSWIPASTYKAFIEEITGSEVEVTLERDKKEKDKYSFAVNVRNPSEKDSLLLGVPARLGSLIFQDVMNKKATVIEGRYPGGETWRDQEQTGKAQLIANQLREEFGRWGKTAEAATPAIKKYNELFAGFVPKKGWISPVMMEGSRLAEAERLDGRKLTTSEKETKKKVFFPGAASNIILRPHQIASIFRSVRENTLLAHSVGTGKTFTLITIGMEMRRLGTANKPLIVVHNATLGQFANSVKKLYPSAKVLVATSTERKAENRRMLLNRIKTGNWDLVIIPQSFYDMLQVSQERQTAELNRAVAEITLEMQGETNKNTVKQLEAKKKTLLTKIQKLADKSGGEKAISFEELGVDALLIDEAHAYKRGDFFTKSQMKGIDRASSGRALGTKWKTDVIRERVGNRNIVMATGTPISNTLTEAWTFMRYLRPDLLEQMGITSFDDFSSTFASEVTEIAQKDTGEYAPETRFGSYANMNQFIPLLRSVFDVVMQEDIRFPRFVKMKGGETQIIEIDRSPQLAGFVDYIRRLRKAWDNLDGKQRRDSTWVPLVIQSVLRTATIDVRMIDPTAIVTGTTKIKAVSDNVKKIYSESSAVKGTQFIFMDRFQDRTGKFNMFHEIKKELVAKGIPANEIAIINDFDKDEEKQQLFDDVRSGKVRVIMGSTEKVGVGVDVAERMVALHHVDVPTRPMDWEQRNGRGLRQTNINDEIGVFIYGAKNSFDSRAFDTMKRKLFFITQALKGRVDQNANEVESDEGNMSFGEMSAILSGNRSVIELHKLNKIVAELSVKKAIVESAVGSAVRNVKNKKQSLGEMKAKQSKVDTNAAEAESLGNYYSTYEFPKHIASIRKGYESVTLPTVEKDRAKAIAAILESISAATAASSGDIDFTFEMDNGHQIIIESKKNEWRGNPDVPKYDQLAVIVTDNQRFVSKFPYGENTSVGRNLGRSVESVIDAKAELARQISKTEKEIKQNETLVEQTKFTDQDKLDKTKEKAAELKEIVDRDTALDMEKETDISWLDPAAMPESLNPAIAALGDFLEKKRTGKEVTAGVGPVLTAPVFQRGGRIAADLLPQLAAAGIEKALVFGQTLFGRGVTTFGPWASRMVARFKAAVRPFLVKIWATVKGLITPGTALFSRRGQIPAPSIQSRIKAFAETKPTGKTIPNTAFGIAKGESKIELKKKLQELRANLQAGKTKIDEGKSSMADLARTMLSLKDQGKVLPAIVNATTPGRLATVADRIVTLAKLANRRDAFASLRDALRGIRGSKMRALVPEARAAVTEILAALKGPTPDYMQVARAIRVILSAYKAQGIVLPATIRQMLAAPLEKMRPNQVRGVATLLRLIVQGSTAEKTADFSARKKEIRGAAIAAEAYVMKQEQEVTANHAGFLRKSFNMSLDAEGVAEKLGPEAKKILYDDRKDGERMALSLEHEGEDTLHDAIKAAGIDPESNAYQKWVNEKVTVAGLEMTRNDKLSLLANLSDSQTRKQIVGWDRKTKKGIRTNKGAGIHLGSLKSDRPIDFTESMAKQAEASASAQETAVIEAAKKFLNGRLKSEMNKTTRAVMGEDVAIRDDYFPLRRDLLEKTTGENMAFKKWGEKSLEGAGFLKERKPSHLPVVISDFMGTYSRHIASVAKFAGFAKTIRDSEMLLGSATLEKTLHLKYGEEFVNILNDQIEAVKMSGHPSGGELNKTAGEVMGRVSSALLAANPRSALKQPGGLFNLMAEIGPADVITGLKGTFGNMEAIRKEIWEASPELRERYAGSGMQMVSPVFESVRGQIEKYPWWHWKSPLKLLQYFDRVNASVAWVGIRERIKKETPGISHETLMEQTAREAERAVNRTQNNTSIVDMSGVALESRKSVPFKILTAFQSQGNKNLNQVLRIYRQWKDGKATTLQTAAKMSAVLVGNTLWVMAINAVFKGLMGSLGGDDKDKKKANPVFLRNVTFQILEENISNVYGGANVIAPLVRMVRAGLNGESIGPAMKANTVIGSTVDKSYEGMAETAKALADLYNLPTKKGFPLAAVHGVKSLEDSTRGILPLMFGVPVFPASILAKLARRVVL